MTAEQPKLERIMRAAAFKATEHRYEIEANIPQQFREWVEICSDGCWRWTGWICPQGYGHCYQEGKRFRTHRLFYELMVGPIPRNLVCDHLCSVRNCVNPAHIELVTSGVNVIRGHERRKREGRPAPNLSTHCRKGHEWTAANTLMHHRGRTCRACQYESMQRYRRRLKSGARKDKIEKLELRIDVLEAAVQAVAGAMLQGGDGAVGDFGWSITRLNKARPLIRAALHQEGIEPSPPVVG